MAWQVIKTSGANCWKKNLHVNYQFEHAKNCLGLSEGIVLKIYNYYFKKAFEISAQVLDFFHYSSSKLKLIRSCLLCISRNKYEISNELLNRTIN